MVSTPTLCRDLLLALRTNHQSGGGGTPRPFRPGLRGVPVSSPSIGPEDPTCDPSSVARIDRAEDPRRRSGNERYRQILDRCINRRRIPASPISPEPGVGGMVGDAAGLRTPGCEDDLGPLIQHRGRRTEADLLPHRPAPARSREAWNGRLGLRRSANLRRFGEAGRDPLLAGPVRLPSLYRSESSPKKEKLAYHRVVRRECRTC